METELHPRFAVHSEERHGAFVVTPAGDLDLGTVDDVRASLRRRPEAAGLVVLDLRELTFVGSSGIRLVVETLEEASVLGHRFAIVRGPDDVQRLFALARIEDRLPFVDDLAEAIGDR